MTSDETDPGGDTGMFQAFVASEAKYEPRPSHKGPFVVVGIAVLLALVAFVVIVNSR